MSPDPPRLYSDLAAWWPLFSPPAEYDGEAADLLPLLRDGLRPLPRATLLELGSGGGSLAFHLKGEFTLTLTDLSPSMLAVSRQMNPECEHIQGDMTSLDLGRVFDRVLVHDAIMYATTPEAARATLRTAARHCRPGGRIVVLPDCVRETFEPETEHGGLDGEDGRALRYLMWTWDPDPVDATFEVAFAFLLRERDGATTVQQDRHRCGCFGRDDWHAWFRELGLRLSVHHDPWRREVLVGDKP